MNDISVVTLVKNRAAHLDRLLAGLDASSEHPGEIIIVDMGESSVAVRNTAIPKKIVRLSAKGLPLAAARNRGAEAASGRHLLFLDVDCIPQASLVNLMSRELSSNNALICAEVRYLGPQAMHLHGDEALMKASVLHPHRQFPPTGTRNETNAGFFWSLLFGIRRETFFRLAGFDEGYEGYGAEDTDFGFRACEIGLPLLFLGGTGAFHQYHGVMDPPLQHLEDIVRNANRFYRRWQLWPMQDWLASFATLGLISRNETAIKLLRLPTQAELNAARRPSSVYF